MVRRVAPDPRQDDGADGLAGTRPAGVWIGRGEHGGLGPRGPGRDTVGQAHCTSRSVVVPDLSRPLGAPTTASTGMAPRGGYAVSV